MPRIYARLLDVVAGALANGDFLEYEEVLEPLLCKMVNPNFGE
jgi:hypothetical protein